MITRQFLTDNCWLPYPAMRDMLEDTEYMNTKFVKKHITILKGHIALNDSIIEIYEHYLTPTRYRRLVEKYVGVVGNVRSK